MNSKERTPLYLGDKLLIATAACALISTYTSSNTPSEKWLTAAVICGLSAIVKFLKDAEL